MWWLLLGLVGVFWTLRQIKRGKLEHRAFKPDDPAEARVAETIKKQMQTGHFTLASAIEAVDEEKYRQQFAEVVGIIASANGYPATKDAMTKVRLDYPAFAEAARHLQIVGDSIAIIERTKNRETLESRIEVVKTNQSAMYAALPFPVDAENIAAQEERNEAMFEDARQRVPAKSPRKRPAAGEETERSGK